MTTYSTRTLSEAIIGDDTKAATRTLRKFLRDDMGEGKAVVGKGGRYALDLNKRDLNAMTKRFKAWETAQEAAKVARAAEMKAKAETATLPVEVIATDEADTDDNEAASPTDEEIAAMLSDDDEADIEDESDDEVDEG